PFILTLVFLIYLVTRRVAAMFQTGDEDDDRISRITGLAGALIFIAINRVFLVEILNPFREPLAYSLVLGAVICVLPGPEKFPRLRWVLAGLLLGLATSTRETNLLLAPFIGLWILVACRGPGWFPAALKRGSLFAGGLAIGLSIFLLQNKMHSGNALVPGYAHVKVESSQDEIEWDIPIPGMSKRYFADTAPSVKRHMTNRYGYLGLALICFMLAWAITKRNGPILILMTPPALLYSLFYCFYLYKKERYLFVVDIFAIPMIALGLSALLLRGPLRLKDRFPGNLWQGIFLGGVTLYFLFGLTTGFQLRRKVATKIWHLRSFAEFVSPHVRNTEEKPARFLGRRHYGQLFSWHLDGGDAYEPSEYFIDDTYIRTYNRIDDLMVTFGHETVDIIDKGNFYIYGNAHPPLIKRWLDFKPLLSMTDCPVPMDHYGRILDEQLYEVRTWSRKEVKVTTETEPGAAGYLLWLEPSARWLENLPLVLLGIRSTLKPDIGC
ncbi:MAG: hypothetical protein AAF492_21755, partial [Verrucomicrobiota bacterium]